MDSTIKKVKPSKSKVFISLVTGGSHKFEYTHKEKDPDGNTFYWGGDSEDLSDPPVAIWDASNKLFTIYTYTEDYSADLVINTNHVVSYHVITGQVEPNYLQ